MALRPGLRVIGNTLSATFIEARFPGAGLSATHGRRWFACRHCGGVYLGGMVETQEADVEAVECFAHEALCAARPTGLAVVPHELTALEAVYGAHIRDMTRVLDVLAEAALTADERARAIERRGVLVAELVRIGLPVAQPT